MRTARSSSRPGAHPPPDQAAPPGADHPPPDQADPPDQAPRRADPPPTRQPPGSWHPPHRSRHPPVNRITDICKNITFPQLRLRAVKTSFLTTVYDLNHYAQPVLKELQT